MFWSAAGEKTRSKLYVLLLSELAPMDSSTSLPLTPSVLTTTVLFSLTSRLLRPRQRTTTLMLVSSPPASESRSRAFRLVPAVEMESAGDAAPLRSRAAPRREPTTDAWRAVDVADGLTPRLAEPARMPLPMAGRPSSRSERVVRREASATDL